MKKKVFFDVALNMIASIIPVFMLQFAVLPFLGRQLDENTYGTIVTLVALVTVISLTFGNVINNIRLLKNEEYKERGLKGDFNRIILFALGINSMIIVIGDIYYEQGIKLVNILLLLLFSNISLLREYYIVQFRIIIDFRKILVNNVFLAIGYGIGTVFFVWTGQWQWIYLLGYLCSLLYTLRRNELTTESLCKTQRFYKTMKECIILLISSILSRSISYIDKLLLFPLLGAHAVSVYYAATLFGKGISLVVSPINSVMLSYLSKWKSLKNRVFHMILFSGFAICFCCYWCCILVSRPMLELLYPQWAAEAMTYVYVTTLMAMLTAMISIINPFILKFCDISWTMKLNFGGLVIYVLISLLLFQQIGIWGFCLATVLADVYKLIRMIILCSGKKYLINESED